jgi:hypothetical protein
VARAPQLSAPTGIRQTVGTRGSWALTEQNELDASALRAKSVAEVVRVRLDRHSLRTPVRGVDRENAPACTIVRDDVAHVQRLRGVTKLPASVGEVNEHGTQGCPLLPPLPGAMARDRSSQGEGERLFRQHPQYAHPSFLRKALAWPGTEKGRITSPLIRPTRWGGEPRPVGEHVRGLE